MVTVFVIVAYAYFWPFYGVSFAMHCLIAITWKRMGSLNDITGFIKLSIAMVNMWAIHSRTAVQC